MTNDKESNTKINIIQNENCPTFEIFNAHNNITNNSSPTYLSEKNISSDGKSSGENNQK